LRCEKTKYRGYIIYYNEASPTFGSKYISIVNPRLREESGHLAHCHINRGTGNAKKIIDVACDFERTGYTYRRIGMGLRNKACRLTGMKIYMN